MRSESPDLFVGRVKTLAGKGTGVSPSKVARTSGGAPQAGDTRHAVTKPGERWPGSHDALAFLWEDATRANEIRSGGQGMHTCRVHGADAARFSDRHGMDVSGGRFEPEGCGGSLLQALQKSGAFTFEAVVTPAADNRARKGSKIVSFGDNFVLRDSREDLRLYLRTTDAARGSDGDEDRETVLGHLDAGRPTHVVVSYRPGTLVYFANGREVFRSSALRGDLRNFAPGPVIFGAAPQDKNPWQGSLEAVALYARFVDASEAAAKFALLQPRLAEAVDDLAEYR